MTTGAWIWAFQTTAHDNWDYDCSWWQGLANATIAGVNTEVLLKTCKDGYLFEINAVTGNLIWALDPPSGIETPGSSRCPLCFPFNPDNASNDGSRLPNSTDQLRTHMDNHLHERPTTSVPHVATRTCWLRVRAGDRPSHAHDLCDWAHGAWLHGLLRPERVHLLLVHGRGRSAVSQLRNPLQQRHHMGNQLRHRSASVALPNSHHCRDTVARPWSAVTSSTQYCRRATSRWSTPRQAQLLRDYYIGAPMDQGVSIGAAVSGQEYILVPVGTCSLEAVATCPGTTPGDIVALTLQNVPPTIDSDSNVTHHQHDNNDYSQHHHATRAGDHHNGHRSQRAIITTTITGRQPQ